MKNLLATLVLSIFTLPLAYAGKMPVEEYVQQVFVEGIPYERALNTYNKEDVPTLLRIINNPNKTEYWANAIVLLEIIGGDSVVKDIIAFIEKDNGGTYLLDQYAARNAAIMGLGYFIHRTENEEAMRYLAESLSEKNWEKRDIQGLSEYHATTEERNQELTKFAMLGLVLAGNEWSSRQLHALKSEASNMRVSARKTMIDSVIDEAITANKEIAKNGLVEYYSANAY